MEQCYEATQYLFHHYSAQWLQQLVLKHQFHSNPYDINIVAIGYDKNEQIAEASHELYEQLTGMGYEVLLDDRKDGYGTKMKDSELIGIPLNIIIGKQFIENKEIELKSRAGESSINPISDIETVLDFFKDK